MKLHSCIQPTKFLGMQYPPIDHKVQNSWVYNSYQLITCKIPGHTAGNHAAITCHHIRGVLCTHIIPRYGLIFAHMLTYLPNPCALSSKLEYSPVTKIRESKALLIRQCSSCLGEYGLTLWVVSILMYTQELHHFSLSPALHATWSKYNLASNICMSVCPRISNILINNTNCMPMNFQCKHSHNYNDVLFYIFADRLMPAPRGGLIRSTTCAKHLFSL